MASPQIPHLRQTVNSKQLIVKDEPFLMLAGELQNSSFSSPEYMNDVWSKLTTMNMNTVLGSVSWEQIEPTEGNFDFQSLDQVLLDARAHGLHVVLLWFGSFKNGEFGILKVTEMLGLTKVQVSLLTRHIGSNKIPSGSRE
jgi:GH35 family endo-1,4-beta-xylanase